MADPFAIHRASQDRITVLALDGFLDAHTAPEFEQTVEKEIGAGNLQLIIDCHKLTYISSAGLGVFMSFIEEIRERGGDIKISGPSAKVSQVFELLGFPSLFDIMPDVNAAVQKYAEAPVREVQQ